MADTQLRVYTPINIQVKNGPPNFGLAAGKFFPTASKLSLNAVKALYRWTGFPPGATPANWATFTEAMRATIQAQTPAAAWKAGGGGIQIKVW